MEPEESSLLRDLLLHSRVLSLGVLVEGSPYVGMVPFVAAPRLSALLVHVSSLALHSRGLGPGAPFSALIHAADDGEADPLQLPRVTLRGRTEVLERGTRRYDAGREIYQEKFPSSVRAFALADFRLCSLAVERGRLVAGFGRIRNLTASTLEELSASA